MKRLVDSFKVEKDGVIIDEFTFHQNSNNHAEINNNSHCLFSGYSLEAVNKWDEIKKDMELGKQFGFKIVKE